MNHERSIFHVAVPTGSILDCGWQGEGWETITGPPGSSYASQDSTASLSLRAAQINSKNVRRRRPFGARSKAPRKVG
jgi:hypothetical protein